MFNKHRIGADMTTSIQRLPQVKARTGLSRTSIYDKVKQGTFPRPVSLGARAVGWLESSVTEWIEGRPETTRSSSTTSADEGVV